VSTTADKLASEIRALPDDEKLRLVDAILTDLDKSDPRDKSHLGGRGAKEMGWL